MSERLDFTKVNWYEVLPMFGIDRKFLSKNHGPCPLCTDSTKGRRFRFANTKGLGEWFCSHCSGGNALTLLRRFTGSSDAEILTEISEKTGLLAVKTDLIPWKEPELSEAEVAENRAELVQIWRVAKPVQPTDCVTKYLQNRVPSSKVYKLSKSVRMHPHLKFYELDEDDNVRYRGTYPGMVLKVVAGDGTPITLHRHYLTQDGQKAPFAMSKKQMRGVRKLRGAACRLIDILDCRTLGVCEGAETGWAIATAYKYRMSVWSLLNAGNLAVADIPRERFDTVIIFADHDRLDPVHNWRPGEHAALKLKEKLEEQGFKVEIRIPPLEGQDYCDVWLQHYNSFKHAT